MLLFAAIAAMLAHVALPARGASPAAELHVAADGADTAEGTASQPLRTLAAALGRAKSGGSIVVHAGTHRLDGELAIRVPSVTIRGAEGGKAILSHGDAKGPLLRVEAARVSIDSLTLDGRFVEGARAIVAGRAARGFRLKNCEIRNFTRHAVDVDGDETLIEGCTIHHVLWWHDGKRDDAHGIVSTDSKGLTIRDCTVQQVSGDCFQAGRGRWNDVVIENCRFGDAPLESDAAGFRAGTRAAENAIDTKRDRSGDPAHLVLRHCRFYGFRSDLIRNSAALNLKEHVDAVVDGCEVLDSEIGLRLRASSGNRVLRVAVVNSTIHDCDVGIRYEDGFDDLTFVHNTLRACRRWFVRAPANAALGRNWRAMNNLFLAAPRLPAEAAHASNRALPAESVTKGDSFVPRMTADFAGEALGPILPRWYGDTISTDQAGRRRPARAPTIGAFEPE